MSSTENLGKLSTILNMILNGEVVLPEFQRSFVWDPGRVREFLVSILEGLYTGALLFLGPISQEEVPFAVRLIEGVREVKKDAKIGKVIYIVLDGQQRLTSLFYARYEPKIPLKGKKYPHVFFVDLEKALNGHYDEAVIAISKNNKKLINQYINMKYVVKFSELFDIGSLAEKYKKTIMIGRTHGQHALPITLGFKLANYVYELTRSYERICDLERRVILGKMSGAVGTMAAWKDKGLTVESKTLEYLGLKPHKITTQVAPRDGFAELVSVLAILGSQLDRLALEVRELSRPEIGELYEAVERVGSSTCLLYTSPSPRDRG